MADFDDPDQININRGFGWTEEFQKTIVSLILTDKSFILQAIDLIKPDYFENKSHKKACELVFSLYKKYNILPSKTILLEELRSSLKDDKSLLVHLSEISGIYDFFEPNVESRDYLCDKIVFFAKIMALKTAMKKSMELISKAPEEDETWVQTYDILKKAMSVDKSFEMGLEYFKNLEERYLRKLENEKEDSANLFCTGFEGIDLEIKGGYRRGEMIGVVANSGIGKSVWLSNMVSTNLLRGKKCLYIACGDAGHDRVAERFDSILTDVPIFYLLDDKINVFDKLNKIDKERNLLVIKWFPSTTANVDTIRAYLSQCQFNGFYPDMVVVDYIGEMKDYPGMPLHDSREKIIKELKGMAGTEQVFMAVAMQPNRGAKMIEETGVIEEQHLADSMGQIRPLEALFSLNQNKQESPLKVGRLYVIKQRFGNKHYCVYMEFNPKTLQIKQIDKETYKNLVSTRKEKLSEEIEEDLSTSSDYNKISKKVDSMVKPLTTNVANALALSKNIKIEETNE